MPETAPDSAATGTEPSAAAAPKQITNAQTVCNERNEKNKLCNGHLKQINTAGQPSAVHLRGDDVLFKCQSCGVLYMGPPFGHVRDPEKQPRLVEYELAALLQAAGGTLPRIEKNENGVWVLAEHGAHAQEAAKPAAKPAAEAKPEATAPRPAAPAAPAPSPKDTSEKAPLEKIPGAEGPAAGETPEQKLARLKAVVAEAKRRKEAMQAGGAEAPAETTEASAASNTAKPAESKPAKARSSEGIAGADVPVAGETPEQKIERLKAVVAEAKRRKAALEAGGAEEAQPPTEAKERVAEPPANKEPAPPRSAGPSAAPIPGADGPAAGETPEQKIARLKAVVAEAKRRKEEAGGGEKHSS